MNNTLLAPPTDRNQVFIGGRWIDSTGTSYVEVIDPWTEAVINRVRLATRADVDTAVAAARQSFDEGPWRLRSPDERAGVLDDLADRITARADHFARLAVLETGTPESGAVWLPRMAATNIKDFAAQLRKLDFEEQRPCLDGSTAVVAREPDGVVAAVTAFNGPLNQAVWKLFPALAVGCSVVLKTAPETPLMVLALADLLAEIVEEGRIDPGTISILVADRDVSEHLVRHPEVDHITFTGSSRVGKEIMKIAGERIAKVTLELGGKSAAIILDDADLDQVMESLPLGGCQATGQACIALSRVLVSRARHDELVERYTTAMSKMVLGDPQAPETTMGPFMMEAQLHRVERWIEIAKEDGATIVHGGKRPDHLDHGFFIEPTLLEGVTNDMRVAREEVFGPVISVITYEDEQDAIRLANDSDYGLAGSVYSSDPQHAYDVARRIRTGTIAINRSYFDSTLPFGGYKQSGLGREGGREGLEAFTELKTIFL